MILPGAEPFLLPGGNEGVLLIHGLTGLPPDMRLLGDYLHAQGFTVLAVRLAGHGTSAEDLATKTSEDWLNSVRDGYAILTGCTEKISLVGHSLGGLLALCLALEKEVAIANIVTMGAPLFVAEEQGVYRLPPRESCVGQFTPRAHHRLPDVPDACQLAYTKLPLLAIHELLEIAEMLRPRLREISTPLLAMHSWNDHTAARVSADYICGHVSSKRKKLVWFKESGHMLPLDIERGQVFSQTAAFLREG